MRGLARIVARGRHAGRGVLSVLKFLPAKAAADVAAGLAGGQPIALVQQIAVAAVKRGNLAGRYGVVSGRQAVKKMHGDQDHTHASRIPWVACTLPRSIGEGELTYEALRKKCAAIKLEVRVEQRPPHP